MSIANRIVQGLVYYSPSHTWQGYTLFSPMKGSGTFLIDMKGRFVHYWRIGLYPACHAELLPNGHLLFAGALPDPPLKEFGGIGGKLLEVDWEGNIVWEYEDRYMHHDFCRLPNGNTMILRWVETPSEIAKKVQGGIPGTEREGIIWSDAFQEIAPDGTVMWEWLGYEHLNPEDDPICPLCNRAEWSHANTCNVLSNGNVLTSFMRLNTIAIIDKETGDFKWKWGRNALAHQHDPTMLDNGNILVFDNGTHRSDTKKHYGINWSRVLEVNIENNEIEWEYSEESLLEFNGCFLSGCHRLPNGNTLITEGTRGIFFEVTPEKEIVWEYVNPFYGEYYIVGQSNAVFKARRYSPEYPAFVDRDLNPHRYEVTLEDKSKEKLLVDGYLGILAEDRLKKLGY